MAQVILKNKVTVFTRQTLSKLQRSDLVFESDKSKRNIFYGIIEKKLGSFVYYTYNSIPESYNHY